MHEKHETVITLSLNTDIGEGFGAWTIADDEALLDVVTDANFACGFHAGDPDIMRKYVPDCPGAVGGDRGTGRLSRHSRLRSTIHRGAAIHAHGRCAVPARRALCVRQGRADADRLRQGARRPLPHRRRVRVLCAGRCRRHIRVRSGAARALSAAHLVRCRGGRRRAPDGYIDRASTPEGLLVPRGQPGAVITDPAVAARRAVQFATDRTVAAVDGSGIPMPVDSVCVHSDSPGALVIAEAVRRALEDAGVQLRSLARAETEAYA